MTDIPVPHNRWLPRDHQMKLWTYLAHDGGKRAMVVWHRRAGKDEVALHHTAVSMMTRPGNYWHCLPEFSQGRKAIWTAVNPHSGRRRIDEVFPQEFRDKHQRSRDVHPFQERQHLASRWFGCCHDRIGHWLVDGGHCVLGVGVGEPERVGLLPADR